MASGGNKLIFSNAEKARDAIIESQKKEIAKLYEEWAKDLAERAKYYKNKTTSSSYLSEIQAKELQKALREQSRQVSNEVYKGIKQSIYTVADSVVKDNVEWLKNLGFSGNGLNAAFSSIPDQTVRMLITGQIYEGSWNLSSRIWSNNEKTLRNCYQIVAKGMAENTPIYNIAKELEKYVQPGAAKKWNPYIMMKNTKTGEWERKKIYRGKVDYNAQRLSRTLVQHGYQQSFIAATEKNPFVLKYEWSANGSRPCPLCQDRDGETFEKGNLPMDHPNGQCTMIPVIDDDITDKLADWFNSPDGTYPDIDEFSKKFGYQPIGTVKDFIDKYGTSTKSPNAWFNSLTPEQKAEATALKNTSGLTWNKWYEQNVYVGDGSNLGGGKKQPVFSGVQKKYLPGSFDLAAWQNSLNSNNLGTMCDWCDDWLKLITQSQRNGVTTYTGSAYTEMNEYLRGMSSSISASRKDAIKQCSNAMAQASLPQETIVRRGSDYNMLRELGIDFGPDNKIAVIGSVVEDKGFVSTSPNPSGGFSGYIEYVIRLPEGSQAMYVAPISEYEDEQELLINRGGRYMVDDVEYNDQGEVKKIYMTLINLNH